MHIEKKKKFFFFCVSMYVLIKRDKLSFIYLIFRSEKSIETNKNIGNYIKKLPGNKNY